MKLRSIVAGGFAAMAFAVAASAADSETPARSGKSPPSAGAPAETTAVTEAAPAAGPERAFSFETRTDAVDEALSVALGRKRPLSEDPEEAGEIMGKVAKAKATLRANAPAAARTIVTELDGLPKEDVASHAALFSLLSVVADQDAAIQYWSKKLATGKPRARHPRPAAKKSKTPDQPNAHRSEYRDPEAMIRYLAMAHLYEAALDGNEKAKAAILEAVKSPHRDVKVSAVQYTFALTKQRWKARLELEERLAPADRYLLNRY